MNVEKTIKRVMLCGHYANIYETEHVVMGFTESEFPRNLLGTLTSASPLPVKELKQVHADDIFYSSEISEPEALRGDGIILDETQVLAVIKTADCTPLFFWDDSGTYGGVLHIGWKGLAKGIETKACQMIKEAPQAPPLESFRFFMGPAIEKDCYEVGTDLLEHFREKSYFKDIFFPIKEKPGKFHMDVKKGIRLSLQECGIIDSKISDSGYCTYCLSHRFPSYRREPEKDGRIFSFMLLK